MSTTRCPKRHATPAWDRVCTRPGRWVYDTDVDALIREDRLRLVLVRLQGGRFTCPIQDLRHLLRVVERGGEAIRDVSVPVEARP